MIQYCVVMTHRSGLQLQFFPFFPNFFGQKWRLITLIYIHFLIKIFSNMSLKNCGLHVLLNLWCATFCMILLYFIGAQLLKLMITLISVDTNNSRLYDLACFGDFMILLHFNFIFVDVIWHLKIIIIIIMVPA